MSTSTQRFTRHWKEHFSLEVDLIFVKRLRLGLPNKPFVLPGEDVTPEIREALGPHRLKVWWDARVIGTRAYAESIGLLKPRETSDVPPPSGEPAAPEPKPIKIAKGWTNSKKR